MDKLIVTSLRVNKNQRKFAPSLKKVKKNRNKKLENQKTSEKAESLNVTNENSNTINNNASAVVVKVAETNGVGKDSVVIKKLDTLKESKFFGIGNSKLTTPKKNTGSLSRLKLLEEVQDQANSDLTTSPLITNQNSIPSTTSTSSNDKTSTDEPLCQNHISPSYETSTPIPITSPAAHIQDKKLITSDVIDHNDDTISNTDEEKTLISTTPKSISIPSSPKEKDQLKDMNSHTPQSNSVPTTPVRTNDNTRLNSPVSQPISFSIPTQSLTTDNPQTKSSPVLENDTIIKPSSHQSYKQNNPSTIVSENNPSSVPATPTSTSTITSNNELVTTDSEPTSTIKINTSQKFITSHTPILSQQQNSPNRKRKYNLMEELDLDSSSATSSTVSSPTMRKQHEERPSSSGSSSSKETSLDLEEETFNIIRCKLDKLIQKMSKRANLAKNGEELSELDLSTTSEMDDSTYTGSDMESEKLNVNDLEEEEIVVDNDDDDDEDYEEPTTKKNKKRKIAIKKPKVSLSPARTKTIIPFSELEKEEDEEIAAPIVFNKRTLADIIDNYHGKELSNLQKEKYKIAARKRKATLRKKRLSKLGEIPSSDVEDNIEVKKVSAVEKPKPNENVAAVQMRVVNGQVVIDQSSLFIRHIDTSNELPITMMESKDQQITSLSFKKNSNRSKKWQKEETDLFYQCISICGTDFGMMSVIMPNRNRKQLINKYHRETRLNPERIRQAFEKRKMLDNNNFNAILEKINQKKNALNS